MISEWNRLGHQQQHMPADYPYQWSSNVANLAKTSKINRRRERLHRLQRQVLIISNLNWDYMEVQNQKLKVQTWSN